MRSKKDELIRRFNEMYYFIPRTIKALDDIPDDVDLCTILDPGELQFCLTYNFCDYLKVRREIAKNWLFIGEKFNEYGANYYAYFTHKTLDISLSIKLEFEVLDIVKFYKSRVTRHE